MKRNKILDNLKSINIDYITTRFDEFKQTSTVIIADKEGEIEYTCKGVSSPKSTLMIWHNNDKLILIGTEASHLISLFPSDISIKISDIFMRFITTSIEMFGRDLVIKNGKRKYTCEWFAIKCYEIENKDTGKYEYTNNIITVKKNYYNLFRILHVVFSTMKEFKLIENWGYPQLLESSTVFNSRSLEFDDKKDDKNLLTFSKNSLRVRKDE